MVSIRPATGQRYLTGAEEHARAKTAASPDMQVEPHSINTM
jgi:hypothetical protein